MRMTSTGALPRALAAARPPKPPPTITTRGVFDVCSSAPLIELRLASFIHPFLKLLRPEISEKYWLFAVKPRQDRTRSLTGRRRSLGEPETDQQNQDERGQNEPRDHDDLDPHAAHRRNVVVDVRIAVKKAVTVAKNICAA